MSRIDRIIKLLQDNPDDVFLNFSLGMEYLSQKREDLALHQFDKTISLEPTHLAAHFRKCRILVSAKDEAATIAIEQGVAIATAAGDEHIADQLRQMLS